MNATHGNAADKVVYEAAASCLPVLASNPVFDSLLDPGQRFARDDPDELAARIGDLAVIGGDGRAVLGRSLRERVAAGHSVESWARGILEATGIE